MLQSLRVGGVCTQWLSTGPTGDRCSAWISNAISNFSGIVASVGKVKCSSRLHRDMGSWCGRKYTYCPLFFFWNIFRGLKTPRLGQKMLHLIFFRHQLSVVPFLQNVFDAHKCFTVQRENQRNTSKQKETVWKKTILSVLMFVHQFHQSVSVFLCKKARRSHHFMQANVAFANAAR